MGKKGTKRKTRWRVLPIGGEDGCNGVCSNNEDEADGDRDSASPLNNSTTTGTSYARASAQQRMPRTRPTTLSRGGSYNYRHRSYYHQPHDSNQPLVTTDKKTFNEEEYTKITTPRQDVLFKKGYLGRKRPTAAPTADTTANVNSSNTNPDNTAADVANGNLNANGTAEQNGERAENDQTPSSDMMSPLDDQPQYIYATNGYVDQTGGPAPGLYYINGSGYELYNPYPGNVTVLVGPAPHYGGPGGGPPVLAAVPCQPLPLQPLEWFNPAFLPYVTAPCHNGLATARDRRKRYSTDSQNCSPQSSESTEPPGSPQECDPEVIQAGEPPGPAIYTQAPAYVYPGYMFGPPIYNVNGVTVQGAPTQPTICDITGSSKRRKKKKRKRRRRGAEDGCSEESSSDEKELEEPMSVTSQESSSQEIESDSKLSTTLNNDSGTSLLLSSCQTLSPTDCTDKTTGTSAAHTEQKTQLSTFDSEIPPLVNTQQSCLEQDVSAPSLSKQIIKDTYSNHGKCDFKPVVKEREKQSIEEYSQDSIQITKDNSEYLNSVQLPKDQSQTDELHFNPPVCTSSTFNTLQQKDLLESSVNCHEIPCVFTNRHSANDSTLETRSDSTGTYSAPTRIHATELGSSENTTQETETDEKCYSGKTSSVSNEFVFKTDDSAKPLKQKKSGKQANVKHRKNSKERKEKQSRPKTCVTDSNININMERIGKKEDVCDIKDGPNDNKVSTDCTAATHHTPSVNSIPSEITTEVATVTQTDSPTQETEDSDKSQKNTSNTFLNRFDNNFQTSNAKAKDNPVTEMDGNENKSTSAVNELTSSEESMQSGRRSHSSGTKKHDLFPEFKSSCEGTPTRPVRKEKRKSSPVNAQSPKQNPSDVSTKSSITAKSLQLPTISLRPDVPKTESKSLHEVSLSKLKGTADILESITTALTTEPLVTKTFKATVHKGKPVFQETECTTDALHSSEPSVTQKSPDTQGISNQTTTVTMKCEPDTNEKKYPHEKLKPSASTSSQSQCEGINEEKREVIMEDQRFEEATQNNVQPLPPPRSKKLHACKHILTEHSLAPGCDAEGGSATDESSGDSTTSSTTHESEESVIELLSSTRTSPDDRTKQVLSSDEEEDIIFTAKTAQGGAEVMNIKSVPPDKPDCYTPSISGPSLQDSSQISDENEYTASKIPCILWEEDVSLKYSEMYADRLSKIIISEAVSESSKKQICLPITEAVTRWLRSQSPEILSLPPPEDESESDVSSEEEEPDERAVEATGYEQMTGQKNVFCNPLPVPLLEDCHHLLVNSNVNHSGHNSGTGRRVALNDCQHFKFKNENIVSDKCDNNRTTASVSFEGDKMLVNGYDDKGCISSHKHNCVYFTPVPDSDHETHECQCQISKSHNDESVLSQCPENVTCNTNYNQHVNSCSDISQSVPNGFNHKNVGINTVEDRCQNEISLISAKANNFQNMSKDVHEIATSLSEPGILNTSFISQMKCVLDKNEFCGKEQKYIIDEERTVGNSMLDSLRDDDDDDDDECSFTSEMTVDCEWDLWDCNPTKPLPVLTTPKSQTPLEEVLAKTPDDYCSHMCDPTVSVAKYYSLGAIRKKSVKFDEDEILSDATDSSDEIDALKHFQCELEDDDGLQTSPLPSNRTENSDKNSNEGHKRYKTFGNPEIYKSHYGEPDSVRNSGIQLQEEADRRRNLYNAALSHRVQAAHSFHRKSSVLVSKLKGDGPFPCGCICCILQ